ncbi:hypothetical protein SDC9_199904 [bioreactor metagenome]|uniref:Uncharacterized protein n=1 Tax=bioreactor metagenome TaxID=1076179 RepID=A0A645ILS7_9ZZZZ
MGNAAPLHDLAGQNEQGDGQKGGGVHGAHHPLNNDDEVCVAVKGKGNGGGKAQAYADGNIQDNQNDEGNHKHS